MTQIATLPEAIGGHPIPFAAGHEVIRQGHRDLTLIGITRTCSTTR